MAFRLRIFQIQKNALDTDIEIVAGTTETYSPATGVETFRPISISPLEETLELEEGVYRIGNLSVTCAGINDEFFNDYGSTDDIYIRPFVFTIEEDSDVLFHGVIDPESIRYNARTKLTTFNVLDWLYLLGAKDAPARQVYETDFGAPFSLADSAKIRLPKVTDNGDDLSLIITPGDIIVFNSEHGEHRSIVLALPVVDGDEIEIEAETTYQQALSKVFTAEVVFDEGRESVISPYEGQTFWPFKAFVTDRNVTRFISENSIGAGSAIKFTIGADTVNGFVMDVEHGVETPRGDMGRGRGSRATVIEGWVTTEPADISTKQVATVQIYSGYSGGQIDGTARVEIHGNVLYGVANSTTGDYASDDVLAGIFTLPELGVLKHVTNGFPVTSHKVHHIAVFPDNPLKALRLLQNTNGTFLRLVSTLDVSDLPRVEVQLITREDVNTTAMTPLAAQDVLEWTENSAIDAPTAVIVRPNEKYKVAKNYGEVAGFYWDGIDDIPISERRKHGIPTGDRVVEISVNIEPAYAGLVYGGNNGRVINDTKLKEIAKYFWQFYDTIDRTASGQIAVRRSDLLGNFVSFNDVEAGRTIFITKQTVHVTENRTSFEGRLGEFVRAVSSTPVARITGPTRFFDTDNDGNARVILSGLTSYDPLEEMDDLTFEWFVNGSGIPTSTLPYLNTTLGIGDHTIELRVTNSQATFDSDTITVEVVKYVDSGIPFDINGLFEFEKAQISEGSIQRGQIRIYPNFPPSLIQEIRFRSQVGGELSQLDKSVGDYTTWYPNAASYDVTDPLHPFWQARVTLADNHNSSLEIYVKFDSRVSANAIVVPFSFDINTIPFVAVGLFQSADDVFMSWEGDEDLDHIEYVTSTASMPTALDLDNNGIVLAGQTGEGIKIEDLLAAGQTLYVRVRGFNASGDSSTIDITRAVTRPLETIVGSGVSVLPTADQSGGTGTLSLTVIDPDGRVTNVRFRERVGNGSWSAWFEDNVAPFDLTEDVSLTAEHNSAIEYEVWWEDDNSVTQKNAGHITFDLDVSPDIRSMSLRVFKTGNVDALIKADEDTASIKIEKSIDGGAFTLVQTVNTQSFSGEVHTGLTKGSYITIRATPYPAIDAGGTAGDFDEATGVNQTFDQAIDLDQVTADKIVRQAQNFSTSISFAADDNDTIQWTAGNIQFADGTSESILAGSATIVGTKYFYFDLDTLAVANGDYAAAAGHPILAIASAQSDAAQKAMLVPVFGSLSVNSDNLSANSVQAQHIIVNSLSAVSASTGALDVTGVLTIGVGGSITNASATYTIDDSGITLQANAVDWDTHVGGTGKPDDNATVGASWTTNLTGIPTRFGDSAAAAGLYLTASFMGYWNGSAWDVFIDNTGDFGFNGDGSNFITWDGTTLTVRGSLNADDIDAGIFTTTGGFKFGNNVSGANDGLYLNLQNYWIQDGTFRVGSTDANNNYIRFDGTTFTVRGELNASDINAGTISTARLNITDIFAQIVTITGSLTMGTDSVIQNAGGDYSITDDGISIDGAGYIRLSASLLGGAYSVTTEIGDGGITLTNGTITTTISHSTVDASILKADDFVFKTASGTASLEVTAPDVLIFWDTLGNSYDVWHEGNDANIAFLNESETVTGNWTLSGAVYLSSLPTTDPLEAGRLWNSSGTVKVSSG